MHSDSPMSDSAAKAKQTPAPCATATLFPEAMGTSASMPVGSQKRKARKSKITHLVRSADGRVSPAEGKSFLTGNSLFCILYVSWKTPNEGCSVHAILRGYFE